MWAYHGGTSFAATSGSQGLHGQECALASRADSATLVISSQGVGDALVGGAILSVDAVGVDLKLDGDAAVML